MSHGQHRAPKPPKTRRLRRIAAGIGIAAAAATGAVLIDQAVTIPQDTTWGAPAPDTGTVTPLDTTWG